MRCPYSLSPSVRWHPTLWRRSDDERAGARAAAGQGLQAIQEHRWADAVDLFTRAESLVDAATPLALPRAGPDAAWTAGEGTRKPGKGRSRAPRSGRAPAAFRDAQSQAQVDLNQIEERLPYVTVNIGDGAGANPVIVTQDGKRIPDALVGVPRPVDPGIHQFQATAAGPQASAKIDVKDKARETVVLNLASGGAAPVGAPTPAAAPAPAAAAVAPATAAPGPESAPAPTPPPPPRPTRRVAVQTVCGSDPSGAFGVGVVGLGLGTVFALTAKSKQSDSDNQFTANNCKVGCPDEQATIKSLDDKASSARTLAAVGFIAGGVGVATGVVLFIMSNKHHSEGTASGPTIHPWIDARSAGVFGTF